jgi:hypothetical protein
MVMEALVNRLRNDGIPHRSLQKTRGGGKTIQVGNQRYPHPSVCGKGITVPHLHEVDLGRIISELGEERYSVTVGGREITVKPRR